MISQAEQNVILGHPVFCNVPPEWILQALESTSDLTATFRNGELLPVCGRVGFLISGKATIHTTDPSRKALLRILSKGDAFGLAGIFSDEPEMSRIYADGTCRCVFFSQESISLLLEKSDIFRQFSA